VALTEQGSYLASLARGYKFREVIFDPPGIHGRFSGLIHFSLFLTAAGRLDKVSLMESIHAMKNACGPSMPLAENPAVRLAAFLAAGEREGMKRLMLLPVAKFLTSPIASRNWWAAAQPAAGVDWFRYSRNRLLRRRRCKVDAW
jgi:glucose-6-phosphate isomerase